MAKPSCGCEKGLRLVSPPVGSGGGGNRDIAGEARGAGGAGGAGGLLSTFYVLMYIIFSTQNVHYLTIC